MLQKNKRKPDKKLLLWQRKQECLCMEFGGCIGDVVPAHIYTRGMSMKCDDKDSVPLCYTHHNPPDGLDGMSLENFKKKYGIDVEKEAKRLYKEFLNGQKV